jgi:hypothetical protein
MNLLCASANRLSACGRVLRPWLGRTLLPAAVLDHAVRDPFGLFVRVFCALGRLAVNPGPTFSDERETGRSREGSLQPKGESQSLQR